MHQFAIAWANVVRCILDMDSIGYGQHNHNICMDSNNLALYNRCSVPSSNPPSVKRWGAKCKSQEGDNSVAPDELNRVPPVSLFWMQSCTELKSPLLTKMCDGFSAACMTSICEKGGPLQAPVRISLCMSEARGRWQVMRPHITHAVWWHCRASTRAQLLLSE